MTLCSTTQKMSSRAVQRRPCSARRSASQSRRFPFSPSIPPHPLFTSYICPHQPAAPAALCACVNLVCQQLGNYMGGANPSTMVAIVANMALPKLYAVSAMWTLNSRAAILQGAHRWRAPSFGTSEGAAGP
jgi:hypothetical protein